MNSEFNTWLLIVGLVIGAGLVWLILADSRRRDADVIERERSSEARWIAEAMRGAGRRVADDDVLDVLRLHAAYLAAPPPDEVAAEEGRGADADAGLDRWVEVAGLADRPLSEPEPATAADQERDAAGTDRGSSPAGIDRGSGPA